MHRRDRLHGRRQRGTTTGFAARNRDATATRASAPASSYGESGPALADRWNGTSWTAQTALNVTGAASSQLQATSCATSTFCLAVGYLSNPGTGQQLPLAEKWNGSTWSVASTPAAPSGAPETELYGVSCTAATACTAVGSYYTAAYTSLPLAERFNGTAWSIQTLATPANAENITLREVSCSSATACTAVGSYTSTSTFQSAALAEQWNGSSWKLQTTPQPASATGSALSSVSCKTATTCTAAGSYTSNSAQSVAYEITQVAGTWKVQTIPLPAGTSYSLLGGVSCTAATACTAVGTYQGSSGSGSYAERYNGTAWKLQSIPSGAYVTQVSCATATACTAVGSGSAAGWNGTTWTAQQMGTPTGGGYPSITGVSCISATVCEASGSVYRAIPVPVAERSS